MIESSGRGWFFEHKNDLWRGSNWVIDQPGVDVTGSPDEQIDFLMTDMAVRELLTSYTDAYDSKDLERTMAHFADESVLVNPRATFVGKQEIEAFYRASMIGSRLSFHRVQNVVVRPQGNGEAWLSAYFHAPFVWPITTMGTSQLGRYFGRAVEQDGRWLFADWRISVDFMPAYVYGTAG